MQQQLILRFALSIASQARVTVLHILKRLPLTQTECDDNRIRVQLKTRFACNHVALSNHLARLVANNRDYTPDRIEELVWQMSYHLLLREGFIPRHLIYNKFNLDVLIDPRYLERAKQPEADILEAIENCNAAHPETTLNGKKIEPLLYFQLYVECIRYKFIEYFKFRDNLLKNPSMPNSLKLEFAKATQRIKNNWPKALDDIEKVAFYQMDTVLSSPAIDKIFNPTLFTAGLIKASFVAMKMKMSGEALKIVNEEWDEFYSQHSSEEVVAACSIFLQSTFNTTDYALCGELFEYEQSKAGVAKVPTTTRAKTIDCHMKAWPNSWLVTI